jgi:hypothetical protein
MSKLLKAATVIFVFIAPVLFFMNSSATYTTSNNKEDECKKTVGTPEEAANSLVNSSVDCRVVGKGPFHGAEFIHFTCSPEQGDTTHQFIFGNKEACGAFKELNSVEYIKLHLTTMLPPN